MSDDVFDRMFARRMLEHVVRRAYREHCRAGVDYGCKIQWWVENHVVRRVLGVDPAREDSEEWIVLRIPEARVRSMAATRSIIERTQWGGS